VKNLAYYSLAVLNLPLVVVSAVSILAFVLILVSVLLVGFVALALAAIAVCLLALPNLAVVCLMRAIKGKFKLTVKRDAPGSPHFMSNN